MMKKPIYLISILVTSSVLFLTMCAKESGSRLSDDGMKNQAIPIVDYTDAIYEMTWIARSLPIQLENQGSLRALVETQVNVNPYWQTLIEDVKTSALSQFSYDLTAQTISTLNLIDPNNDFTSANLTGFTINIDDYMTFIYIPDFDIVNKNAQIVVVPAVDEDEVWGYFHYDKLLLDPQGNPYYVDAIDSVIIDEYNYSNYYIWVVDAETDHPSSASVVDPANNRCDDNGTCEPFEDKDCIDCVNQPCNNNGICEGWEDPIQCEDCNPTYTLRIKSYKFKKDRWGTQQFWLERWLQGKYELRASFRLFTRNSLGVLYKRDTHEENDVFDLLTLKRKEVCREKGGYTSRGCKSTPKIHGPADFSLANGILSHEFREKDEFNIIFYEDDSKKVFDPKRGHHLAWVHGASHDYTYHAQTCSWSGYPYGSSTVPVERMNFVSSAWPMFETIDVPTYETDPNVKRYVVYSGQYQSYSKCNLRDATTNIKFSDFTNNEYTIDNDYVHIVLEIY